MIEPRPGMFADRQQVQNSVRPVHAALAAKDVAAARRAIDAAATQFPNRPAVLLALARVCEAEGGLAEAESLYQTCAARLPSDPAPWAGLARLRLARGEPAPAAIQADGPARPGAASTEDLARLGAARQQRDWPTVRDIVKVVLANGAAPTVPLLWALGEALQNLQDWTASRNVGEQLIALAPEKAAGLHILLRAALELGDADAALATYRRLAELKPDDARFALKVVRVLQLLGRPKEANAELRKIEPRYRHDPRWRLFVLRASIAPFWRPAIAATQDDTAPEPVARDVEAEAALLRQVLRHLPGDGALQRPLITDDDTDVILSKPGGSGRAVLVFTTLQGQADLPIEEIDRYFASLNVQAIYLRDFSAAAFGTGVRSLGSDEAETIAALRNLLASQNIRHLTCMGFSGGGFPAVRFGLELSATHAVSFGGLAVIEQNDSRQVRDLDLKLIAKPVIASMADRPLALRPLLEAEQGGMRVTMVYGENSDRDAEQAQILAGLKLVTLHAVPGVSEHQVFRRMAAAPDILEFFRSVLAVSEE